jgi:hypothetical protein
MRSIWRAAAALGDEGRKSLSLGVAERTGTKTCGAPLGRGWRTRLGPVLSADGVGGAGTEPWVGGVAARAAGPMKRSRKGSKRRGARSGCGPGAGSDGVGWPIVTGASLLGRAGQARKLDFLNPSGFDLILRVSGARG